MAGARFQTAFLVHIIYLSVQRVLSPGDLLYPLHLAELFENGTHDVLPDLVYLKDVLLHVV